VHSAGREQGDGFDAVALGLGAGPAWNQRLGVVED
jgi:hypothetical protein